MRILMISGIRTAPDFLWPEFRCAFKRLAPGARFCVATEPGCDFYEIDRFNAFALKTASRYDTGEDLVLVGHSMGGVLACAIEPLLTRTRVLGITTIHSPHRFLFGAFTHLLRANRGTAPVLSFQGLHDGLVWWGTKHPRSVRHVRNHANHFHDLWEHPENAELIARATVQTFIRPQEAAA